MNAAPPPAPTIPLVDLAAVHEPMADQLGAAFAEVLRTSAFTGGPHVERFEERFAQLVGTTHAVSVGSGTAALQLALMAAGIGRGDEVVLPPNTFFATAEAVVAAGAAPVLADVDPMTALLDADAAAAAITSRTAAIIPVDLYGQPVDAEELAALGHRHRVLVLEDACQALGGAWEDRPAGSLFGAAAFSFYPTKNLGALGDGGAVTTDDEVLARRVRQLRNHGEISRHDHRSFGFCERLDGLQAALMNVKLEHLGASIRSRAELAATYRERVRDIAGVTLLHCDDRAQHANHLFVVAVDERDAVLASLHRQGIGAAVHYPTPIHLQPAGPHLGQPGAFPASEHLAARVLSLPLWPGMSLAIVERVVAALERAVSETARPRKEDAG